MFFTHVESFIGVITIVVPLTHLRHCSKDVSFLRHCVASKVQLLPDRCRCNSYDY